MAKVVKMYVYDDGEWADVKQKGTTHITKEIMKNIRRMCKKQNIFVDVPDGDEEINYEACKMTKTAEALCNKIVKEMEVDRVIVDFIDLTQWEFTA